MKRIILLFLLIALPAHATDFGDNDLIYGWDPDTSSQFWQSWTDHINQLSGSLGTGGAGTSDHGLLTGLGDDDHAQYLNTTRGDARYLQSESDPGVATHEGLVDPHTGYMLESNIGTGANNYIQLDGTGKLPAVDGSQLTNLPGGSITATGFNGNLTPTDDTVQEVAQKFDDYVPTWGDVVASGTMPGGFSDGVDNTGLPAQIIFYSNYVSFTEFDTACTSGVLAYGDVSDTWSGESGTLDCIFQVMPGVTYTKGASANSISFTGQFIAGEDELVFSGFTPGEITFGKSVRDVFAAWFGAVSGDAISDNAAMNAALASLTDYQNLYYEAGADYDLSTQLNITNSGTYIHGRNATLTWADSAVPYAGFYVYGGLQEDDSGTVSVTVTKGDNTFTLPAQITTLEVGDAVHLWDEGGQWIAGYDPGWYAQVVDITGSTVTLSEEAAMSFTADSAKVYNPISDVTIDSLTIDQTGQSTAVTGGYIYGAYASWGNEITYKNIRQFGSEYTGMGLSASLVSSFVIENSRADTNFNIQGNGSGGRTGYAFALPSGGVLKNSHGRNAKHLVVTNNNRDIYAGPTFVDGGTFYNEDQYDKLILSGEHINTPYMFGALDSHAGGELLSIRNVYVSSPEEILVRWRNPNMKISDSTFMQRSFVTDSISTTNTDQTGIIFSDEATPNSITISGSTFTSEDGYPLMRRTFSDELETYADVDASNTFSNVTRVKPGCSATNVGNTWYVPGAASTYEVCQQTGASTYAWKRMLAGSENVVVDDTTFGYSPNFTVKDDLSANFVLYTANDAAGATNYYRVIKARGTPENPTALLAGDYMGIFYTGGAYDSSGNFDVRGFMQTMATENWSPTGQGWKIEFRTKENGTTGGSTVRLVLPDDGGIDIESSVEPTCDSTNRGQIVFTENSTGVADTLRVCMKNAADAYVWTAVAAP